MRMIRKFNFSYLLVNIALSVYSQDTLQKSVSSYVSPMDLPLTLSGNFGDIRSNSFHFGLDFRTNEKEGYPVFAVKDGFVSRIKIESGGYGRAVYIDHPDNTTTVYAHLSRLCDTLAKFVKAEQYKHKSFAQDIQLKPEQFWFNQCDTIGFSGNAGYSFGPHLHFEVRETKSQNPLNPIYYSDLPIIDTTAPVVKNVWVYPRYGYSSENYDPKIFYNIVKSSQGYIVENNRTVYVPNNFGLGFQLYDNLTDAIRRLSIFNAQLYIDNQLIYWLSFDSLSFTQMGQVNSLIDIAQKIKDDINVYKFFNWENQNLIANKFNLHNGFVYINDTLLHSVKLIFDDASANRSVLDFNVKVDKKVVDSFVDSDSSTYEVNYNQPFNFKTQSYQIEIPAKCLYQNACVSIDTSLVFKNLPSVAIGSNYLPLKIPFIIKASSNLIPGNLHKKAIIVSYSSKNKISALATIHEHNQWIARPKSFGRFGIAIDTIKPGINFVNIKNNKDMSKADRIMIKISDNLSGIRDYKVLIDKKWKLFEYDAKNDLLTYYFEKSDENMNMVHSLYIEVVDKCGNKSVAKLKFRK